MAELSAQEIQQKIAQLPPEVQSFLYGPEMAAALQHLAAKHQLHVDQVGELEGEVAAAMIGISSIGDLEETLKDTLSLDGATAKNLVADVNNEIFVKIRNGMKTATAATQTTASPVLAPATAAPTAVPKPVQPAVTTPQAEPAASTPTIAPPPIAAPAPTTPAVTAVMPTTPPAPKPVDVAAETILTQKTSSVAPAADAPAVPPQPAPYKASDPYREPPE